MPSDESKGSQLDAIGSLAQRQLDNTVTRDALEGRKGPHFRYWSLIAIFECHVCAKGGSGR